MSTDHMDVEQALDDARTWHALPDANGAAHTLAAEVERLRAENAALDERAAIAVEVTGRRWSTVAAELRSDLQVAAEALRLIAGDKCENYTGDTRCWDDGWGRTRNGDCTAQRWCDACIAQDALNRAEQV